MLISVKSPVEAAIAAAADGVNVVDVKDPSQGSLGFAGAELTNQIAAAVGRVSAGQRLQGISADRKLVSVALGELHNLNLDEVRQIDWASVDFVKIGLSGLYEGNLWRLPLSDALAEVPSRVKRVLVLYVDQVDASSAEDIVKSARNDGLSVVLLDTFDKSNGNLFAHWAESDVDRVFGSAKRLSMTSVLAGSIGLADISRAFELGADLIGVRGAVCDGDRSGNLCQHRLNELLSVYREKPHLNSAVLNGRK